MKPKLMGVINITPDSYFEKSRYLEKKGAIARGIEMWQRGADLLDIGGESSRPFADPVPLEEELDRVIPVIAELSQKVPIPLSIDTYKPEVAKEAVKAGAKMINDISGFRDPKMVEVAANCSANLCVMHMRGEPKNMQENPQYPDGIIPTLKNWFSDRIRTLTQKGIDSKRLYLDPGIGFGKTVADNLEIIHNLSELKTLGYPLLLGISRKSFLQKILKKTASEVLPPTLAVNTYSLLCGVDILRVHDVAEHRDVIDFFIRSAEQGFSFCK